jgi:hypothetical protein
MADEGYLICRDCGVPVGPTEDFCKRCAKRRNLAASVLTAGVVLFGLGALLSEDIAGPLVAVTGVILVLAGVTFYVMAAVRRRKRLREKPPHQPRS